MSWEALAWAWPQDVGCAGRKVLLIALADAADSTGTGYRGQESLSKMTNQSKRSVSTHMKWLEENGYLTRTKRFRKDGTRTSDYYHLQMPLHATSASGNKCSDHMQQMQRPHATVATEPSEEPSEEPSGIKHVNSPEIQRVDERELVTASPSVSASVFGETWNEYSGNLPKIRLPLTPRRVAAVNRLQKEHGAEALEVFRAAVQAVARNDFWVQRRYGFDNLVPGKVERYAEQWTHSGELTGADVKLLTRAQRIAAALGDDE